MSEELAPILAIIYNKSLQTGTLLDGWKKANVSVVFKKEQCYNPANYRPVSLTCLCCKVLEHIIVSSVLKHVDTLGILSYCRHNCRARRSCETQLVTYSMSWPHHWTEEPNQTWWSSTSRKLTTASPTNVYFRNDTLRHQREHSPVDLVFLVWPFTASGGGRLHIR